MFIHKVFSMGLFFTSLSAYSFQYDNNQHLNFLYHLECNNYFDYCIEEESLQFSPLLSLDTTSTIALSSDLPLYLTLSSDKNWSYLKEQTYTILGLSIATVGFMTFLPESITKWDNESVTFKKLGQKWKDNVKQEPVWDKDEHILNYIMHPYFGGVYYTAARHSGFNEFESFIYSWSMSTFFWEYGVEAFAETPSWQDLFVTPLFGALIGEMMLEAEQSIIANDGKVLGSQRTGSTLLFLLNPVGHIHHWTTKKWGGHTTLNIRSTPWFNYQDATHFALDSSVTYDSQFIGVELTIEF